jgi:4-amino-4-deoxy-L-arabinose transferase-like glycosyltransferase
MYRLPLVLWIGLALSIPSLAPAGSFVPSSTGTFGSLTVSIEPGFIRPGSGGGIRLRAIAPGVEIRITDTRTANPPETTDQNARFEPVTADILLENVFRERTDLPPGLVLEDVPEGVRFTVALAPGEQKILRFQRRPSSGGVRFGMVGDCKSAYFTFARQLEKFKSEDPDFVVILGDFVNERPFEYDVFAQQLRTLRIPVFPVLGNHDRIPSAADPRNEFRRRYGPTYHAFEYQGIGFWFVDSANDAVGAWQEAWLRTSLDASPARPKIVFMHIPPYNILEGPMGHGHSMRAEDAQRFLDLVREGGVDRVFAGHINGYAEQEYGGTRLILTSGGGESEHREDYPLHTLLVTVGNDDISVEMMPDTRPTEDQRAAGEREIRNRVYIRTHISQIAWGSFLFLMLVFLLLWLGRKNRHAAPSESPKGWQWGVWLALALCVTIIVIRFATPKDFYDNEQCRQGIYVQDILFHHHWLLQWDAGAPATKPPLYNWLAAVPCLVTGSPWDQLIRLPSAFAAVGMIILVYFMGVDWAGRKTGTLSAVILIANFHFAKLAGLARTDMLLAFFIVAAMWVFWRRAVLGKPGPRWAWFYLWIALAVLTKGPAGILVPGLAAAGYLLWSRDRKSSREMRWGFGFLLILGAVLLWFLPAVLSAGKGYFTGTVLDETWNRFLSTGERAGKGRPFYYYLPLYLGRFAPWGILSATIGIKTLRRRREILTPEWRFVWAWLLITIGFFSLSAGKRADYIFPAYPAAALIVGRWIAGSSTQLPAMAEKRILQAVAVVLTLIGVAFILLPLVAPLSPSLDTLLARIDLPPKTEMRDLLRWGLILALSAGTATGILLLKRGLPAGTICLAASLTVALGGYFAFFCPPAVSDANEEIEEFCEDTRCEINDLPLVYLNRVHHAVRFYLLRDGPPATEDEIDSRLAPGKPFCLMESVDKKNDSLPGEWLQKMELLSDVRLATDFGSERYRLYRSLPPDNARLLPLPSSPGEHGLVLFAGPP